MFQRREKASLWQKTKQALWPKKGLLRPWVYIAKRILRINASPHDIAMGVACGIFGAVNPIYGLQMITAAVLALIFRANMVVTMLATWVGNPFTYPIFWAGSWLVGHLILDGAWPNKGFPDFHFEDITTQGWRAISPILTPMLVGFPVVGLVFALFGYALSYTILKLRKNKDRNKRPSL